MQTMRVSSCLRHHDYIGAYPKVTIYLRPYLSIDHEQNICEALNCDDMHLDYVCSTAKWCPKVDMNVCIIQARV